MPKITFVLITLCALLSACGQKGALYLPNKTTPTPIQEPAETPNLDAPTADSTNNY